MQKEEWVREIVREVESGKYPKWPNETMVKLIFGGNNYLKQGSVPKPDWNILDVGCLFANNLLPFAELGCACFGVDIHPEMLEVTQRVTKQRGIEGDFRMGSNRNLPYPDGFFDLVLSVNTIHYEGSLEKVLAAFGEFKRVLKPGGRLFLSTVAPDHEIQKRSVVLGEHRYEVSDFDFRDGEVFFFFDGKSYLDYYLSKYFHNIETGRVTEKLMKNTLDFFFAVAHKPRN